MDKLAGYTFALYESKFRDGVIELQQHLWGNDREKNIAYIAWKYENNPYPDATFIRLALFDGKVVGMSTVYGAQWEVGQPTQKFLCPLQCDIVIHPDHRMRGVGSKLSLLLMDDLARHGSDYIFALSANPGSYAASLRVGFQSVGVVETATQQVGGQRSNPLRAFAAKLPFVKQIYHQLRQRVYVMPPRPSQWLPFETLDMTQALIVEKSKGHIALEKAPRPEAMAELVERLGTDGRIRHTRDSGYFAWRFNNPRSMYRFLFWENNQLEGYLVLQAWLGKYEGVYNIIDWEATSLQAKSDLLLSALENGQFPKLETWSASLPQDVKAMLQERGFHFYDATTVASGDAWLPPILIRAVQQDNLPPNWRLVDRDLLKLENWNLRAVYSDTF